MAKKKKKDKGNPEAAGEAEEGKPKKGGLIGAILTPILLAAASFGTVYSLPGQEVVIASDDHAEEDTYKAEEHLDFTPKNLEIVELNEFVVSLRQDRQVLRILLALEAPSGSVSSIDPNDLRLRDAFMSYLRAIEVEQLEDVAFMPQLRAQLLRRAKLVLGDENVSGVLITDFLIR
jgi:flagellar FliL protein